jgi:hypothetical protein
MPWSHGSYFSDKELAEMESFLISQDLNEQQRHAVLLWLRSQIGGTLALWCSMSVLLGRAIGFKFAHL